MGANKIILNNKVLLDLEGDTVTEADVTEGVTFHKADGSPAVGTNTGGSTSSTIPPEISTEAEMNALEIGTVFRYVGETTEAFENGAYYVVEKNGYTVSVTSTNKDVYVYEEAPTSDNYETIALGTVSSGSTVDFTISTGKLYIIDTSGANLISHSETGGVEYVSFENDTSGFLVAKFNVTDNGTTSVTYGTFD